MSQHPEHDKLHAVVEKSQEIGEFLEWLQTHYVIATYTQYDVELRPIRTSIQDLLAEYFGIDLTKLEGEKRVILNEHREKPNV